MPCLYCSEEGFSIGHHGACIHCNSAVCVAPGGRRDRRFHGENCVCGCDGLFCLKHFVAHAQDEHGMADGAACFPRLWTRIGIRGIRGGAALRARVGSPPEAAHDATEFLNTIRPGHEALRQAARELPGVAREYPEWGNRGEPKIIFEPAFFNDAVAETVVAQAADAVGAAYEGRPDPADVADLARQSAARPEEVLRSLRELGEWHFKGRVPSGDALRPWMPPEAPRELASELARAIHLRRPRRRDREAVAGELVMEYRAHGPARVTRGWDWRLATDEALEAGIEFEERWGGAAAAEDDEDEHGHRHGGHDHHAY